ncbi:hypothetical protein PRIC2_012735 [Phytophthora ramorum]
MPRRHSLEPPTAHRNDENDSRETTLFLVRRLLQVLRENLLLRQEVDRSRGQRRVLQRRLAARTRQLEDLVTNIREFARLYRFARAAQAAAEAHEGLRRTLSVFATIDETDDSETETVSISATSIVPSSLPEDEASMESSHQPNGQL